jgi:small-conductance mechanosensitive channel
VGEVLGELAGLLLLIWIVNKAFRWINNKSLALWEMRIARLSEKKAPFGYAVHLLPVLTNLIRLARLCIIILLVYLTFPIVFFILPGTKPFATELLSYIINPLKRILLAVVHYVPNLLTIVVIFVFTRYIVKLVKFIAGEIENGDFVIKNFYPEWAIPTYNIIRILLYTFMFVVIFPYLPGSDSRVFQGVTLFFGVLFSFGSSSAISNAVAGIVLTYMRPFKIGDRVRIGEILGDVIEKNLLITRVRTSKNEDITVPNSTILSGATINYSSSSQNLGLILNTNVIIGYDKPLQIVHELLIEAALSTEGIAAEPSPFVLQTALNEFNVTYQLNAYTAIPNKMSTLYSGLHKNILSKFHAAGIEILSPHFTAFRDGNAAGIPGNQIIEGFKKE